MGKGLTEYDAELDRVDWGDYQRLRVIQKDYKVTVTGSVIPATDDSRTPLVMEPLSACAQEVAVHMQAAFEEQKGKYSQLELQRVAPTDVQMLTCLESMLLGSVMHVKHPAYLSIVHATADRPVIALHRRMMDAELEVRVSERLAPWQKTGPAYRQAGLCCAVL